MSNKRKNVFDAKRTRCVCERVEDIPLKYCCSCVYIVVFDTNECGWNENNINGNGNGNGNNNKNKQRKMDTKILRRYFISTVAGDSEVIENTAQKDLQAKSTRCNAGDDDDDDDFLCLNSTASAPHNTFGGSCNRTKLSRAVQNMNGE